MASEAQRGAWGAVRRAVAAGELVRPSACEECGVEPGVGRGKTLKAHHEDYARPLDVRWLCASCHAVLHLREEGWYGPTYWAIRRQVNYRRSLRGG